MASASQQQAVAATTRPTTRPQSQSTGAAPPPSPLATVATPPRFALNPFKDGTKSLPFQFQAPVLTGAAAMAEQAAHDQQKFQHDSRTSPNPATNARRSLASNHSQGMSRPHEAPPVTMSASRGSPAMIVTAEPMQIDEHSPSSQRIDHDNVTDPRLTAPESNSSSKLSVPQERSNKALSYPPRADQIDGNQTPSRSMTLPGSSSRSPGTKKHKCHHCGTEFTRQHNLKSHLLTHSQEKPFECTRCEQKFRRLHDLKRHTKLHTGERPHTCNKCGRAFARGDALARHNKGPGGCAGRRGSGGEGDDDEDEDESMHGVGHDENGNPSAKRRKSEQPLHSRKRSLNAMADSAKVKQQSMTYPGPGTALMNNQQANGPVPTTHLSPRMSSTASQFPPSHQSPSVFAHGGMTESPRPLSPGHEQARRLSAGLPPVGRNRSPSLAQQMARSSVVGSPAVGALPATASATTLPPLGSLAPDRPPSIASSTGGSQPRAVPPAISTGLPGPGSASSTNPPSATSQNRSSGGSLREIVNHVSSEDYMLRADHDAVLRKMQDDMHAMANRLTQMDAHIQRLNVENNQLRAEQRSYYAPSTGQPVDSAVAYQ